MKRGRLITIGSFDGVHVGHQALLSRTVAEAKKRRLKSLALTFSLPPRMILDAHLTHRILSSTNEKAALLKAHGIDEVMFLNFSKRFASIKPFTFFRNVLLEELGARGVVVGMDFRFGSGRSAGAHELVRWGQEFEIPVWVIPPVHHRRQVVSSSAIRHLLESGNFRGAMRLLGHPYLIQGRVVKGNGLGRKIGFPTANLKISKGKILPRGIFVVRGVIQNGRGKSFSGVCNIGTRPTIAKNPSLTMEVHIFEQKHNLVGKTLQVLLMHRLRSEKKFGSIDQLKTAIRKDVLKARAFLLRKTKSN